MKEYSNNKVKINLVKPKLTITAYSDRGEKHFL